MRLFLGLVFTLFVGIMVFVYVESKRANPVILDASGRAR